MQRTRIIVELDTDPDDGWGDDPEDFVDCIQAYLNGIAEDCRPSVHLARPKRRTIGDDAWWILTVLLLIVIWLMVYFNWHV